MWLLQTYRVHFGCKGSRSPRSPTKGCLRAGLACTQRAEPQAAMLLIYHRPSLSCELGAAGEPALPPRHIALRSSRASSSQPPPQVFQQGLQKDRLPSWLLPLLSTSVSFLTLDQSYIESLRDMRSYGGSSYRMGLITSTARLLCEIPYNTGGS